MGSSIIANKAKTPEDGGTVLDSGWPGPVPFKDRPPLT
jgi:hypothetical protein